MFRTVPLPIIRSVPLYKQQWYLSYILRAARKLYDIYHCCVYSGEILMMGRGTVRNM